MCGNLCCTFGSSFEVTFSGVLHRSGVGSMSSNSEDLRRRRRDLEEASTKSAPPVNVEEPDALARDTPAAVELCGEVSTCLSDVPSRLGPALKMWWWWAAGSSCVTINNRVRPLHH